MSQQKFDFTEGSIQKKMVLFAGPVLIGNVLQSSYQLIDSLWIGNLMGSYALGALTNAAPIFFAILSFMIGINSSTLTILSQQKGRNDEEGLKKSLNAFVVILGFLSILFGIIGFFSSQLLLQLLGTPEEILPLAKTYLQIHFIGIIFLFGYNFIGTILRALGDSKTPIRFIILAVILNTILDPLFIHVFGLGMEGAAYATVISQATAFLYGLWFSIYKANVPFTMPKLPEKRDMTTVLKLGIPGGFQMIAISSGLVVVVGLVNSFGNDVIAGFGVAQRIENIILLPAFTLGSVVTSMAGQNIGAELWDRVSEIAKKGSFLIVALTLLISILVFFGAEFLVRLFLRDGNEETITFGAYYLKTIAFFYPFIGINFVLNGVARSSGAMFQVLVLNIISFWVLRYPLALLFSTFWGEKGISIGIGVSFVISCVLAVLYYFFGKWREVEIFEDDKKAVVS
ncbi:MATE family efflux transporter [Chengkuizengella axinellae]|uniref:MATE family efflux transporter n=1 Tax=Chengkuizengella axinellae TaxID=3064388 RepID=A0ABT9IZE0_9BACL|nr:MATE family efflux transporter [Chengkuizengella sp. 2205SS18-9]MDP5274692.1 MATE family efflux transporter [Chengkuizengella sp. 2205SS18-9]